MTGTAPTALVQATGPAPSFAEAPQRPEPVSGEPGHDPAPGPVLSYLRRLHERHAGVAEGAVATYIPELASADPAAFGICIVTADGATYEVGDSRIPFTIQSISKPLTYGLILDDLGEAAVRRRIGVEPTGDAFNAITLAPGSGTPLNPMVNAGAIAAVSMVGRGADDVDPFERIVAAIGRFAGRRLEVDDAVYRSERETGHRNRAIGHLLRSAGIIEGDPDEVVERYFRQCAIQLDARDLAMVAATLANGGVNPVTGEVAASERAVRSVLSVMTSCGMYDAAGGWLVDVGLPAKSGVSGGILAVLPGQLGIAVYSPPLDARGNSVRGLAVCRDLSNELGLHLVRSLRTAVDPIRSRGSLATTRSKRLRPDRDRERIEAGGSRVAVLQLQGDVSFLAVEAIARELGAGDADGPTIAVIDAWRVTRVDPSATPLVADLARDLAARGGLLALSASRRHPALGAALAAAAGPETQIEWFAELDHALEWCEERLLVASAASDTAHDEPIPISGTVSHAAHELFRGLHAAELDRLRGLLSRRHYAAGDLLVQAGDPATELFLVVQGELSVSLPLGDGDRRRLATLSSGSVFGELALIGRDRRTADVVADSAVECDVLSIDAFASLDRADPLRSVLLENLLRIVSRTARRMTSELAMLAG